MSGFGALRYVVLNSITGETQKLISSMSVIPPPGRVQLIDTCIRGLIQSGVWYKLEILHVMAAHNSQTALLNWVNPGTKDASEVSSPTFTTDFGYSGATAYVSTNLNPSTSTLVKHATDSIFAWEMTNDNGGSALMGFVSASSGYFIYTRNASDVGAGKINAGTVTLNTSGITDSRGLWTVSRTNSATCSFYQNGTSVATTSADGFGSDISDTLAYLRDAPTGGSGKIVGAGGAGTTLTASDVGNLYFHLHGYLQAVAGIA